MYRVVINNLRLANTKAQSSHAKKTLVGNRDFIEFYKFQNPFSIDTRPFDKLTPSVVAPQILSATGPCIIVKNVDLIEQFRTLQYLCPNVFDYDALLQRWTEFYLKLLAAENPKNETRWKRITEDVELDDQSCLKWIYNKDLFAVVDRVNALGPDHKIQNNFDASSYLKKLCDDEKKIGRGGLALEGVLKLVRFWV